MINVVLDALQTYVMSLFPLLAKVEDRLDKLIGRKGYSPSQVASCATGGLGISNLGLQNMCLLSKWFGKEDHTRCYH